MDTRGANRTQNVFGILIENEIDIQVTSVCTKQALEDFFLPNDNHITYKADCSEVFELLHHKLLHHKLVDDFFGYIARSLHIFYMETDVQFLLFI